jgi:hypothetical protein
MTEPFPPGVRGIRGPGLGTGVADLVPEWVTKAERVLQTFGRLIFLKGVKDPARVFFPGWAKTIKGLVPEVGGDLAGKGADEKE